MNNIRKALFLLVLAISVLAFSGCTKQDGISTFTQCSAPEEMALSSLTLDERFIDCIVQDDRYVFLRKDGWLLWTDTDGERTQEVQLSLPEGSRAYALVLTDKDLFVFGEDRDGLWAMTTDGDVRFTLPDTKLIQATVGKSGEFFILTDGALLQVGEDGRVFQTIDNTVLESVLWYQNMLFGLTRDEVRDCYALSVIDFERKETSQTVLTGVPLPSGTTYAQLAQGADGSFYLATVYALYRIDYNAQTIEKVFSWQAQNVSEPYAVAVISEREIAVCAKKTKLLTVGNDVQTSRVILKLATLTTDDGNDVLLRQCVQIYNDSHEHVQVVLEDYAMRGETREQAMLTLITDILTPGHTPELLDCRAFSRIQYNSLARQGMFMDVSDLLSDRTAFVNGIVEACTVNDAVYSVVPAYSFSCFFGCEDQFGLSFSQNVEELLTRNAACIPDYQPADFLRRVCEMTLDRYIDSETGETRFEQEDFLQLLRTCKAVVQAEDLPAIHYERITNAAKCGALQAMITRFEGSPFVYLQTAYEQGISFQPYAQIAAMAASAYSDEAMEFLRYLISSEYQSQIADALPLRYSALQAQIDTAMQELSDPLQECAAEDLRSAVERICLRENNDEELLSIICDEAEFYFDGQRSETEAAALIANRVELYLKEQGT